jgi:ribonuclease R
MPLRFTHRILDHLAHDNYRPAPIDAIARAMRVEQDERETFDQAMRLLAQQGRIAISDDDVVRLPAYGDELIGTFRLNQRGFGFVIPDEPFRDGDLFVPRGQTADAISGDRVRAKVLRQSWRPGSGKGSAGAGGARAARSDYIGRIVEVIQRGQEHFVGTLVREGSNWFVEPDGRSLHDPVLIRDPHTKSPGGAKPGSKVVIELLHYPQDRSVAEGVIVKVLGEAGRPDVETQAVIEAHGLRTEFPDLAMEQARRAAAEFEEQSRGPWPEREDLTHTLIFTIDPPDAKDFDDAISIEFDARRDEWTLGVHIADVSHFVTPGTALDEEGKARGNSVYLPRLVIPMLPETLSNGVCSLQEGVPRFTQSAFITYDGEGRVIGQRFASTVISSRKRLTYLEAQALIDGHVAEARKHARTEPQYSDELIEALRLADRLAKVLRKRRFADGMIVLNLPKVELVFDEDGHVIDAIPEDDAFTHTIIEMFMVEANEAVARLFSDLNLPLIRRIHPDPVPGDIDELRMYARVARFDLPDEPSRRDLQRLLEKTRHTPAARAIHFAVLRTLTKATYSPAMIGHFALASEHYTHFTSPIRRYPDLSVHRALQAYLDETENGARGPGGRKKRDLARRLAEDDRVLDEGQLIQLGRHTSDSEREAEAAERELREFLVLQFLHEKHLGDEFTGVVTGVESFGVFVSIERFLVEGMVKLQDIAIGSSTGVPPVSKKPGRADQWVESPSTGRLVAKRSGMSIGIGDIVTVQIARVDLATRHLDLMITAMSSPSGAAESSGEGKKSARRVADDDMVLAGGPRGRSKSRPRGTVKTKAKGRNKRGFNKGRRGGRR